MGKAGDGVGIREVRDRDGSRNRQGVWNGRGRARDLFLFEASAFVETTVDAVRPFDMIDLEIRQSSKNAIRHTHTCAHTYRKGLQGGE